MTAAQFRRIALGLDAVTEGSHMGHADFRLNGKIFATLGYPNASCGMVKLTPWQQHDFAEAYPDVFVPLKGAWGLRGATRVNLPECKATWAREALALSHKGMLQSPKSRAPRKRSAR